MQYHTTVYSPDPSVFYFTLTNNTGTEDDSGITTGFKPDKFSSVHCYIDNHMDYSCNPPMADITRVFPKKVQNNRS